IFGVQLPLPERKIKVFRKLGKKYAYLKGNYKSVNGKPGREDDICLGRLTPCGKGIYANKKYYELYNLEAPADLDTKTRSMVAMIDPRFPDFHIELPELNAEAKETKSSKTTKAIKSTKAAKSTPSTRNKSVKAQTPTEYSSEIARENLHSTMQAELATIIKTHFTENAELILSLAEYLGTNNNSLADYQEWAQEQQLDEKLQVCELDIHKLLESITHEKILSFMYDWIKIHEVNELVTYDLNLNSLRDNKVTKLEYSFNAERES
ncbi:hypothetical protein, partial [Psittacicella hinzii]